jgi:hypothetical protein
VNASKRATRYIYIHEREGEGGREGGREREKERGGGERANLLTKLLTAFKH